MGWWLRSTNHSQVTLGSWPSWKHARDLWIYCVFLITADMYPSIVLSVYTICWVIIKEMKRSKIHRKKTTKKKKKSIAQHDSVSVCLFLFFCIIVSRKQWFGTENICHYDAMQVGFRAPLWNRYHHCCARQLTGRTRSAATILSDP